MTDPDSIEVRPVRSDEDRARAVELLEGSDAGAGLSEQFQLAFDEGAGPTLLAVSGRGRALGLAQLRRDRDWELETFLPPGTEAALADALVAAAVREVAGGGGGTLHYWVHGSAPGGTEASGRAPIGFRLGRELWRMEVPLPLAPEVAGRGPRATVRAFRSGQDEARWLAVNNRAFAGHPEQGGWDESTLGQRQGLAWFDPAGFLLHEEEERLAAFCWTKVHRETQPPKGEIYAIAVDPDFHGRGLGRALTVAGLEHLTNSGLTVGMLYVDAANQAAVGLYRSLGFEVVEVDRAFLREVSAGGDAHGPADAEGHGGGHGGHAELAEG